MTRHEIEAIQIGQTGLYPWNSKHPVIKLEPVRFSMKGHAFRYVHVQGDGATIGFIISEGAQ